MRRLFNSTSNDQGQRMLITDTTITIMNTSSTTLFHLTNFTAKMSRIFKSEDCVLDVMLIGVQWCSWLFQWHSLMVIDVHGLSLASIKLCQGVVLTDKY